MSEGLKSALIGSVLLASSACAIILASRSLPLCESGLPLWAFFLLVLGAAPALAIPPVLGAAGVGDWLKERKEQREKARDEAVREIMES